MPLKNFDELIAQVRSAPVTMRVALAASQDEHSLEAIFRAVEDGLVRPVLIGDKAATLEILRRIGAEMDESDIHDEPDVNRAAAKAVELIREGAADFLMKGKMQTGELLAPVVNRETGLGRGGVMSHLVLNQVPRYHKLLGTTDGGMLTYPTLEQKKALIENAVGFLHALGYEQPKIGVLAAVETPNPKMPETLEAAALKEMNQKGELTGCIVEGPISLDLALVKERSAEKHYESPVAGDADVLVSPNIHAGNVLGKSLVEMGGAKMAGIVLGAKAPVIFTSRGSTSEEKYLSIVLAAAASGRR